jgi:methionine-rich copper-binding protein CopC
MRTDRSAAVAAVAAIAVATGVPAALAHTEVSSTSPAGGATAKTTIRSVSVTFGGPLKSGTLRVTGPGGSVASVGAGARDPRNVKRLLVGLKRSLRPGSYGASWKATAADGHRQHGSFRFTLRR